ncbi:MAG: ATP-binding cassette domain-containing protein, partial [Bacteroidia bacterium]
MLKFENIHKHFGKLHVLKGVNLDLPESQVVAIIGPNGSGKTTLLKSLLGLVVPDEGDIKLNDISIKNDWLYRKKLGYMSQISRFPENITIKELLDMMKDIRKDVTTYDEELFHIFKVEKMLEKKLGTLSGGTKQKISAVLAFMFQPKIVVLDEPTAGLDPL